MSSPFFSIIIPCLNEQRALPHLLKDLQNQTYADFDVWIVDGNSEDSTPAVVQKIAKKDKRFHLITSKVRNVGYQRNLGAHKSRGSYVLFFDADNRIPSFYLAGVHYQCAKDNIDAFTTFAQPDTENAKDKFFMSFTNTVFDSASKIGLPFTFGACIGCKRDVFMEVKGFDETMTFGEDTEFVRRVVQSGYGFNVLHEPTYVYSLRRFRKEGTLTLARKLTPIQLNLLMNKKTTQPLDIYPMLGGGYFEEEEKKKGTTQTYQQLKAIMKTLKDVLTS